MPELKPQPGPQQSFFSTPADIAFYGGAAGGGKTWALLAEPLRHVNRRGFSATIFRRTYPEIKKQGGPWDESVGLYPQFHGTPIVGELEWRFRSGARVGFGQLQHEASVMRFHGSQIPLVCFDELTEFTEYQFTYLLSRNRSVCGVRPYVRATCNPDASSWVAQWIEWWIDQDTGYPIPDRSGVVRWFVRDGDTLLWADTKEEAAGFKEGAIPKSFTFIAASLSDNKILMQADPDYLSNLLALPRVEQERLLRGNWKIVPTEGEWPADYFAGDIWFDDWPDRQDCVASSIGVDPSKARDSKHGDYRAIVEARLMRDGTIYVDADLARTPADRVAQDVVARQATAKADIVLLETNMFQELFAVDIRREAEKQGVIPFPLYELQNTVPKVVRVRRLGTYLHQRRVKFRRTAGAKLLVTQLGEFPNGDHDDGPDAMEMAFRGLSQLTGGDE